MKLHKIEWNDHCSSNNRWMSEQTFINSNAGMPCTSVGKIIAEDADTLTLVGTWGGSDCKGDQTIIKSCITSRRRLYLKNENE